MDNGSLKIQYNRNRYYDYYTGRWLTHDPMGITPNPQKLRDEYGEIAGRLSHRPAVAIRSAEALNQFDVIRQYKDGSNLYQYVRSNPVVHSDSQG